MVDSRKGTEDKRGTRAHSVPCLLSTIYYPIYYLPDVLHNGLPARAVLA
jgi:hypothetical protein